MKEIKTFSYDILTHHAKQIKVNLIYQHTSKSIGLVVVLVAAIARSSRYVPNYACV